jgi:hypothetical protein
MTATYENIATTTLSTSASSVSFTSISSGFTDIVAVLSMKATSGSVSGVGMRFNNDTATNYSFTYLNGNGSTSVSARSSNTSGISVGPTNFAITETANTFSPSVIHIQNYSNATTNKTAISRGNDAGNGVAATVGLWRKSPAEAINRIDFYMFAGNFDTGSTFTLYGIKAE